ncbi:hypothetical protein SRO_2965 [Streptomyces rochei]|nr:hypothetical protein SRO_2965 [Streptomyces rochei]
MPSGGPGGGLYYESNGAGAKPSAEPKALADGPPHLTRTGRRIGPGPAAVPDEPTAGGTAVPDEGPAVPAPWHTGPMLQHATFVFTYGIRPAGCHGRAA